MRRTEVIGAEARAAWLAKNADLVRRAVALINPAADLRDEAKDAVSSALLDMPGVLDETLQPDWWKTKPAKMAASRLAVAARRLAAALRDADLDDDLRPSNISADELTQLARRCDALVATPSGKTPRMKTWRKGLAVYYAYGLMQDYADPPSAVEDAKKGSRFCRLAAILSGDPSADLHRGCRARLRDLRNK